MTDRQFVLQYYPKAKLTKKRNGNFASFSVVINGAVKAEGRTSREVWSLCKGIVLYEQQEPTYAFTFDAPGAADFIKNLRIRKIGKKKVLLKFIYNDGRIWGKGPKAEWLEATMSDADYAKIFDA